MVERVESHFPLSPELIEEIKNFKTLYFQIKPFQVNKVLLGVSENVSPIENRRQLQIIVKQLFNLCLVFCSLNVAYSSSD